MKKKNITFAILLMAVMVTAFNVSKTYARYVTELEGTATANVAKWAVAFKNGDTPISDSFELTLTDDDSNAHVADGKIAPDSELFGEVTVELEGTEVSTDIIVELGDIEGIPEAGAGSEDDFVLKLYNGETEVEVTDNVATIHVDLTGREALTSANNLELKVVLEWVDNDHNESDTAIGIEDDDITVDLTLTAKQHVRSDTTE